MVHRVTPGQIRKTNRKIIYEYIYSQKGRQLSRQDIANALEMSRPTVAGNLSELENEGLVFRGGPIDADMPGRKPVTWSVSADCRIAVGVEIMKHTVKIIAIDLYGQALKWVKLSAEYENDERYYESISKKINEFISSIEIPDVKSKILGIGFAIQGLVSEDGTVLFYGEILKCTGLKIDVFAKWLDYPCSFIHEPDGAALAELWVSPELKNAVYLSMSEHLGGALISDRKILNGMHRHAATFEHITACPGGEVCYCGKRGCYETVCSKEALLCGEDPDNFFRRVRSGEAVASLRWKEFLKYLARLVTHLHLVNDTVYILGGHLAPYFTNDDIEFLYGIIKEKTPFKEAEDFILISKMPSHNITVGAALPYIMKFLEEAGALINR